MDIQLEKVLPSEIEARSFEIIGQELEAMGKTLDPQLDPVIRRVIHTTADFDYADHMVFTPGCIEKALTALEQGAHMITDTKMAWSGINKTRLERQGGQAYCFISDQDVAEAAAARKETRAWASMDKAASLYGPGGEREDIPCIFAIGNAPTALIRLYQLITEGRLNPALIIAVPVGFVNVVQAKELILGLKDQPLIAARGRKGGSNVAAAICNALLYYKSR